MGLRIRRRATAILSLIWCAAGCIYVPGSEQANLYDAKGDFRDLSGKSPADPLVDGQMTRAQATDLLGPAPFVSVDGHVVVYQLSTQHGFLVSIPSAEVDAGRQMVPRPRLAVRN